MGGSEKTINIPDGDCSTRTMNAAALGFFSGAFFGAGKSAWAPEPILNPSRQFGSGAPVRSDVRALGRAMLRPAVMFAAVSTSFTLAECLCESARNKRDSLNAGFGGIVAGAVMGSVFRRVDFMLATAAGSGILMTAVTLGTKGTQDVPEETKRKLYDTLPAKHEESDALQALKDLYPKFKDN